MVHTIGSMITELISFPEVTFGPYQRSTSRPLVQPDHPFGATRSSWFFAGWNTICYTSRVAPVTERRMEFRKSGESAGVLPLARYRDS